MVREGFSEQGHPRNCQEKAPVTGSSRCKGPAVDTSMLSSSSGEVSVAEAEQVGEKTGRTQRARSQWETDCLGSIGRGRVWVLFLVLRGFDAECCPGE